MIAERASTSSYKFKNESYSKENKVAAKEEDYAENLEYDADICVRNRSFGMDQIDLTENLEFDTDQGKDRRSHQMKAISTIENLEPKSKEKFKTGPEYKGVSS